MVCLLELAAPCNVTKRWALLVCFLSVLLVRARGLALCLGVCLLGFPAVGRGYKETQWLSIHRQSETRAGNHRRHTRTRNASLPTQANHTARGARKQPSPPIRALYMQLAKIPHTHQTTPRATSTAGADQHGTHRGRNRYQLSAHTIKSEAPGQLPGDRKHV